MLQKWTLPKHYMGQEWPDYYVFLGQTRDSDSLTRSNFTVAQRELEKIPEPTDWKHDDSPWQVVRESHWLVGWVEWIAIHQDAKEHLEAAQKMADDIENYPVLDDEHFSELEYTEAEEYWKNTSIQDRIDLCKRYNVSIFAARRPVMPETPTGELCTWQN